MEEIINFIKDNLYFCIIVLGSVAMLFIVALIASFRLKKYVYRKESLELEKRNTQDIEAKLNELQENNPILNQNSTNSLNAYQLHNNLQNQNQTDTDTETNIDTDLDNGSILDNDEEELNTQDKVINTQDEILTQEEFDSLTKQIEDDFNEGQNITQENLDNFSNNNDDLFTNSLTNFVIDDDKLGDEDKKFIEENERNILNSKQADEDEFDELNGINKETDEIQELENLIANTETK